ncbi:MAG: hypothetical protein U0Q21_10090 [Dermatophilaceae bacterium]
MISAVTPTAAPDSTSLTFTSEPGSPAYGFSQNEYLLDRAYAETFTSTFTLQTTHVGHVHASNRGTPMTLR